MQMILLHPVPGIGKRFDVITPDPETARMLIVKQKALWLTPLNLIRFASVLPKP